MSLILEALRKLEREKQVPEPGLVVVGHTPWTSGAPGRSRTVLAVLGVVLAAAGVGLGVWLGRPREAPVASAPHSAEAAPPTGVPSIPVDAAAAAGPASRVDGSALAASPPVSPENATDTTLPVGPASDPSRTMGSMAPTPTSPAPATGLASRTAPRETTPLPGPRPAPAAAVPSAVSPSEATPTRPSLADPASGGSEAPANPTGHAQAPPRGELKLHAISQRDGRPIAVINERLVREGESFDGVLVIRIGKSEVEVEVSGKRRTLTF